MPKSIVCDKDPVFTSTFWKELFCLQGTNFNFSSAYHPQTNGQTEVVNLTVEMYLRCFTGDKPRDWVHTYTKNMPYEIIYGRPPPTLLSYVPGTTQVESVDKELIHWHQILMDLKIQLQAAQTRMKKFYDMHCIDKNFEVGDLVYLRLQPYRQVSVSLRMNLKLSPRYYELYEIIKSVRPVAYKLQ
ncbi:hypothetical protein AMTRI_Chr10g228380 [Amborella trichopoda]